MGKIFGILKKSALGWYRGLDVPKPVLVIGLILILLLIGLVWRYIKKKKEGGDQPPEADEKKKDEPSIAPKALVRAWQEFLSEIPRAFRRFIMLYQHFIVFGESGAGKTVLINNHTDWQGHARQFYPSYTGNPLLQIYLGSKVLVQEIPSSILNDTTKAARVALMKLWAPLFRRKDPTAVVVLNSSALKMEDPQYLKQQAQIMRGKVNLLARIRKKPIQVRLVITNMEALEGFAEFSSFLSDNNIPLKLEFGSKEELARIEECLTPYEAHLSRALLTLSADDYLKVMTFLEAAPKLFAGLSKFVTIFQSPDPLAPEPDIRSLSLAFLSPDYTSVSNPFSTVLSSEEIQQFNPLFKHRMAAAVLAAVGVLYLGGAFFYEYNLISSRYLDIEKIERAPLTQYNLNMHRLFADPLTDLEQRSALKYVPDFFPQANREIHDRGIRNIRNLYVLPELEKFSVSATAWDVDALEETERENTRNKVLYLLGLLYSTRDNRLGELILEHNAEWAENTGLPPLLIKDYVLFNVSTQEIAIDVNDYVYRSEPTSIDDPLAIMVFFEKLKKYYFLPVITEYEFEEVRLEAEAFLGRIREAKRQDLSFQVTELLRDEALLNINIQDFGTANFKSQVQQESIRAFLQFINQSRLTTPEISSGMNLAGLYDNLRVMSAYKGVDKKTEDLFQFAIAGREFRFGSLRWNELLNRTRMSLFLNAYMDFHYKSDGMLFFQISEAFPSMVMNATNNGMFLFKGQTVVDGRFTKSAFEKRVKPVLEELPTFIEGLPLAEKDKNRFYDFLFKEIDAYGTRYVDAYQNYYLEFDIEATSQASLRYVLTQLTSPSSPLLDVLKTVKENVNLEYGDNVYLFTMARKLEAFDFLNRLLVEDKGTFPEMDKYKAIAEQILLFLDTPAEDGGTDLFRAKLSPLGKVSYDILCGTENSYLKLLEQWMESVGIPTAWRSAFASPVQSAYYIGVPEVEALVSTLWKELYTVDIAPLLTMFPFDPESKVEAGTESLSRATHPTGHFWTAFNESFATLFIRESGNWRLCQTSLPAPRIPRILVPTLDALSTLTENLWTAEGEEKAIEYMVKAYPLDKFEGRWPAVSLSYLHAGDFSIFGFNQQPTWKKMTLNWAQESSGAVGLEIVRENETTEMVNAAEVGRSAWNFYHLLLEAETPETARDYNLADNNVTDTLLGEDEGLGTGFRVLSWRISRSNQALRTGRGERPEKGVRVQFAINTLDPWQMFRLPQ